MQQAQLERPFWAPVSLSPPAPFPTLFWLASLGKFSSGLPVLSFRNNLAETHARLWKQLEVKCNEQIETCWPLTKLIVVLWLAFWEKQTELQKSLSARYTVPTSAQTLELALSVSRVMAANLRVSGMVLRCRSLKQMANYRLPHCLMSTSAVFWKKALEKIAKWPDTLLLQALGPPLCVT